MNGGLHSERVQEDAGDIERLGACEPEVRERQWHGDALRQRHGDLG